MSIEQWGAFAFGVVLGWFVYFTNRYRKGEAQFGDIATLLGIVGGAGVTALFGEGGGALFASYGLGLATGFFAYFVVLLILVGASGGQFTLAWFLDGRRRVLPSGFEIPTETRPTVAPMSVRAAFERIAPALLAAPMPSSSGQPNAIDMAAAERDKAIQALHHTIRQVIARQGATQDNNERQGLRDLQLALTAAMQELIALRLYDLLTDPRVAAALAELKQVTAAMQKEAAEIKSAADTLSKAAKLLQKAGKVVGLISGIFG